MPISEARNDAPGALLRTALATGYTGHVGRMPPDGVAYVDGVAQNGCTPRAAERFAGAFGAAFSIVGPWETPAAEPSPPPVEPPPAPDADLAALPTEPAPDDAPGVSVAHPAPPAPSASPPPRIPYNAPPLDARRRR